MWIREFLNDRKWHLQDLEELEILVQHRGEPGDVRTIFGAEILNIMPDGFFIKNNLLETGESEIYIPYHRIINVMKTNVILWEKK